MAPAPIDMELLEAIWEGKDAPALYPEMIARAQGDKAYRDGLLDAARICRAQHAGDWFGTPPCPASMAAVYIRNVANGEMP